MTHGPAACLSRGSWPQYGSPESIICPPEGWANPYWSWLADCVKLLQDEIVFRKQHHPFPHLRPGSVHTSPLLSQASLQTLCGSCSFSPTCDWRILSTPRSLTWLHRPPLPCLYLRCTWLLLIQDHFSFDCRTLEEFKGVSLLPSRLQSKPFWIPVLFKCSPPSCSCRHGPVLPSLASRGAIGPVCQGFYWVPWTGCSEGQENNKGSHSNPPWLTLKRGFYC